MSDAREVGILFSGPMVRSLLSHDKTETRRILKPQPPAECSINFDLGDEAWLPEEQRTPRRRHFEAWSGPLFSNKPENYLCGIHTWKYRWCVGDRLWVRERWRTLQKWDCLKPSYLLDDLDKIQYAEAPPRNPLWAWGKWRPSIFMPRWASRITLEVTALRVERLQEIDEAGAIAEGVIFDPLGGWSGDPSNNLLWHTSPVLAYALLWCSINGPGSWDANPFVSVTTFRRIANTPAIGGAADG